MRHVTMVYLQKPPYAKWWLQGATTKIYSAKKKFQQNSDLITVTECLPARAMFRIILNIFERVPVSKAAALLQKLNPSTVILFFKIPETTVK